MPSCRAPSSITHLRHTDSLVLPPIEVEAASITSPRHVHFIYRLRRLFIALAGQRGFIAAGRWQCQDYRPHPEHGDCRLYEHSLRRRLRPKHRQPRAFLAEAPFLCASAKNRCGLRVDRLFLPPPFRFLHATFAMLRWHGATFRLHSQTIFGDYIPAFPDTAPVSRGRAASIPSPTRNLRLLFRPVDAMPPLSILRSAQADNLRTLSHP